MTVAEALAVLKPPFLFGDAKQIAAVRVCEVKTLDEDEDEMVECVACSGRGYVTCDVCDGEGEVEA